MRHGSSLGRSVMGPEQRNVISTSGWAYLRAVEREERATDRKSARVDPIQQAHADEIMHLFRQHSH